MSTPCSFSIDLLLFKLFSSAETLGHSLVFSQFSWHSSQTDEPGTLVIISLSREMLRKSFYSTVSFFENLVRYQCSNHPMPLQLRPTPRFFGIYVWGYGLTSHVQGEVLGLQSPFKLTKWLMFNHYV